MASLAACTYCSLLAVAIWTLKAAAAWQDLCICVNSLYLLNTHWFRPHITKKQVVRHN